MEKQPSKTEGLHLKKKKKNKGWETPIFDPQISQVPLQPLVSSQSLKGSIQLPTQLQENSKNNGYASKNLSEMSKSYHIQMSIELGSGFASIVYLGQNIQTQQIVCFKVIDYLALGDFQAKSILNRQIKYLNQFNCKHIVRLFDVYESPSFCYLVMEYCSGGDLFKFLMKSQALSSLFVRQIIEQICQGLIQLKKKQLIHRDLKTENIFLGSNSYAKIGDLGFCVTTAQQNIVDNVGSPIYMAPQIFNGKAHSFESDIYGLGVIWYELLHKRAPWEAKSQLQLLNKKLNQKVQFYRPELSETDMNIISKCLSVKPEERASVQQIFQYCTMVNATRKAEMEQPKQNSLNSQKTDSNL